MNIGTGQCNLYADDALLYNNGSSVEEVQSKLQETLNYATSWYKDNKLAINASKSASILIHSQRKIAEDNLQLTINNELLTTKTNIPYIGVCIDNHLKWDNHISDLCKKVAPKIHQLRRLSKIIPKDILEKIYMACIQSHIDYACTVWGNCTKENRDKLQRLQNMAARIICRQFDYINVRGK